MPANSNCPFTAAAEQIQGSFLTASALTMNALFRFWGAPMKWWLEATKYPKSVR